MKNLNPINIGLLMYPGVQHGAICGLIDFFAIVNKLVKKSHKLSNSFPIIQIVKINQPVINLDLPSFIVNQHKADFSVIIIPPCQHDIPNKKECNDYINFLKNFFKQACILASIGNGVFLLAQTQLLHGYTITTHWQLKHEFQKQFPEIFIDINSLIIEEKNIITTAGPLSWIDLGLLLVKKFFGSNIMAEVARFFLIQPANGSQSHFNLFIPNFSHGDVAIIKGQNWIADHKNITINLRQLSKITGLETRTMQRRFIKATGMTITEYIQQYRICCAQYLLQFSNKMIHEIGVECGYKDINAFRKIFTKIVGLSPSIYRRNFAI